jgi:hypothetical protein
MRRRRIFTTAVITVGALMVVGLGPWALRGVGLVVVLIGMVLRWLPRWVRQ